MIRRSPVTVTELCRLAFYGDEMGEKHGWTRGRNAVKGDPFTILLADNPTLTKVYADAEVADRYHRSHIVRLV